MRRGRWECKECWREAKVLFSVEDYWEAFGWFLKGKSKDIGTRLWRFNKLFCRYYFCGLKTL